LAHFHQARLPCVFAHRSILASCLAGVTRIAT
jgi:hypothetical protein